MKQSAMAQLLMNMLLDCSRDSLMSRTQYAIASRLRGLLCAHRNMLVRYTLDGSELLIPLSHQLPIYRRFHQEYSSNLGRLASYVASKYPQSCVIDIGANVGDSIAIIRSRSSAPILAIEGDEFYFHLLEENIERAHIRDVFPVMAFVGSHGAMQGTLLRAEGTASFVTDGSSSITPVPLEEILSKYASFGDAKLLKIDTDGFDCQIASSASSWISKAKPITFIEYDPTLTSRQGVSALSIFATMRSAGYQLAICWENTGEYLATAELGNTSLLEDLDAHYSIPGSYLDIAFIHAQDAGDLGGLIRRSELRYFKSNPEAAQDSDSAEAGD